MRRFVLKSALALSSLLAGPTAALAQTQNTNDHAKVQVVFVLDTTGSMVDLIEGAKQKIWSITNTILDVNSDADITMALIGYRDRGDEYVVQAHHLTGDIQGLYSELRRFEADGGGDTPESVNEALDAAVRGEDWAEGDNVRRIIFLVGDAPPHMDYQNAPRYSEVIAEARKKGIILNTIQAGNDPETREYWTEMARLGDGQYYPIPQDGGQIVQIDTPFDDQIIEVQGKIDATILPYGSAGKQASLREKVAERAEAAPAVKADNSSFYAKKSRKEAVTGGGDMVSDMANGDITIKDVPEDELAPELQAIPAGERDTYLQERLAERQKLEAEMAALVAKRDAYIAEQSAAVDSKGDSFDRSVMETLKVQLN